MDNREEILTIKTKQQLKLSRLKRGQIHRLQIELSDNALGVPWTIPLVIIRGENSGPVLGVTAAIHGNELNGTSTIFKLIQHVEPEKLSGTLILAPICNVPGYLNNKRYFSNNIDLNRIMPGKPQGSTSNMYAYNLIKKVISQFDYLLDLHTASHGRVNSLYIRADLENEQTRTLAFLQNPQIIVQKYDESGTLRAWANDNKIPTITIEIGNPHAFQHNLIDETLDGILNTMKYLKMIAGKVKDLIKDTTICDHSYWLYSKKGGIVDVLPNLADTVKEGEVIAHIYDVFGQVKEKVISDKAGIVIGKNVNPSCDSGTRLLHLGIRMIQPETKDIPGHKDFTDSHPI